MRIIIFYLVTTLLCLLCITRPALGRSDEEFLLKAIQYYQSNRLQDALDAVTRYIKISERNEVARALRCEILMAMGRYDTAFKDLKIALLYFPRNSRLHYLRAKCLCFTSGATIPLVIEECTEAYMLDSTNMDALLLRAEMNAQFENLDAAEDFLAYLKHKSSDALIHNRVGFYLVNLYCRVGCTDETRKREALRGLHHLDTSLILSPANAGFYLQRGRAKYLLGDMAGAYSDCSSAMQLDPKNGDAAFWRAHISFERKDQQVNYRQIIEDCTKAITNPCTYTCDAYLYRMEAKGHIGDYSGFGEDKKKYEELGCWRRMLDGIFPEH